MPKKRVITLGDELNRHNHLYYVLDQPEISDAQYDALMNELRRLEKERPELVTPDSPTQRVGAEPAQRFTEVRHPIPLLSLSNAFDDEEFLAWHTRAANLLETGGFDMVCELKIDGLDSDATHKLADGVEDRWAERWCRDMAEELAEIIDESFSNQNTGIKYSLHGN